MTRTPSAEGNTTGASGKNEFGQHLAAGAAGRTGGAVQIGHGDGGDANGGAEFRYGADQGGALGAHGESHSSHSRRWFR